MDQVSKAYSTPATSTAGSASSSHQSRALTWTLRIIAIFCALAVGLYGVGAIDTGYVNFKGAGNPDVAAQRKAMMEAVEAGRHDPALDNVVEHSGIVLRAIGGATSPKYMYGKEGVMETFIHYAEMPAHAGYVMSLHNTMGGILMLFGGLQFWPALRRKYPRWHRGFGVVYIVAGVTAATAGITYLIMTPTAQINDELAFQVGLWTLGIGSLASIAMSLYHLRRREIAQHQAYMALSYACFLAAPVQRYGWTLMGNLQPHARELVGNFAVTAWLVPVSFLLGYGLFTINRMLQQRRQGTALVNALRTFPRSTDRARTVLRWTLWPTAAMAIVMLVQHFLLAPGLESYVGNSGLVPAGVIALDHDVIVNDLLGRIFFVLASAGGIAFGTRLMWQAFVYREDVNPALGWGLAISTAAAGLVMGRWAFAMGMPSYATLAGGAVWLCGAFLCMVFAALVTGALLTRSSSWLREWSLFALLVLLGIPAFYFNFPVMHALGMPQKYIDSGHYYRLATYGSWFLLIPGFVYSAYGRATQERIAR